MQERRGGLPCDPRIPIRRARRYSFEECEDAPDAGDAIEGGDEMHLTRAWIGEARAHPARHERAYQTFGTVHENASQTLEAQKDMLFRRVSPPKTHDLAENVSGGGLNRVSRRP
jgi:hypothetical protein